MKIKALLFLLLCGTSFVSAQRNEPSGLKKELVNESETFSITESFRLEAGYEMMMIPVVASIKVSETRQSFTGSSRTNIPQGLASNEYLIDVRAVNRATRRYSDPTQELIEGLKSEIIYDFCKETSADVIVMPQFSIRHKMAATKVTSMDGSIIEVERPVKIDDKYVMIVDVVGYPGVYGAFRNGTPEDKWLLNFKGDQTMITVESETTKTGKN